MASDWTSFAEYLGLTGGAQQQAEDEAMQRAQEAEQQAGVALGDAQFQATHGATGQGGTGQLQNAASYGQWQKARDAAHAAYAAVGQGQENWRDRAVEHNLGLDKNVGLEGGYDARAASAEGMASSSAADSYAKRKAQNDAEAARKAAIKSNEDEMLRARRAAEWQKARDAFDSYSGLRTRGNEKVRVIGAGNGTWQGQTNVADPYGSHPIQDYMNSGGKLDDLEQEMNPWAAKGGK